MANNSREVLDGLQFQGVDESVLYSVDTLPWGGSPTGVSHDVFDEEDYATSLKSLLMPGSPTVATNVINLPALSGLSAGKIYRVFIDFTIAGSGLQGYFRVQGEL